jgi:hypothetical protein
MWTSSPWGSDNRCGAWRVALRCHTFRCSTCSHVSRRLVLGPRPPVIDLPVLNVPVVVQSPEPPANKLQMKQVTAGSARAKLAEKLRSRQVAARGRAARARTSAWAEAVEKLRRKQAALKEATLASGPQPDKCARPPARPSGPPNETFSPQGPPHLTPCVDRPQRRQGNAT